MATKRKFNEEDVMLFNRGACDFSFKPFMMSAFVNVQSKCGKGGVGLPINVGLLRNTLMSDIGLQRKFERKELYLEDLAVCAFLGLDVDKTSYMKSYEDIVELLKSDKNDKLESYLDDLMGSDDENEINVMIDIIEKASIDMKLGDLDKIRLVREYTGRLIDEVLDTMRDEVSEKETKKSTKKNNKRGTGFEE